MRTGDLVLSRDPSGLEIGITEPLLLIDILHQEFVLEPVQSHPGHMVALGRQEHHPLEQMRILTALPPLRNIRRIVGNNMRRLK
jgi:hypothetical protein